MTQEPDDLFVLETDHQLPDDPVELKSGHHLSVKKTLVTFRRLQWLFIISPGHTYDLLRHCWSAEHSLPFHQRKQLELIGLMHPDGSIDEDIRQVIFSAVVPEDYDNPLYTLQLHSPIK